jgi:hypothetical protein
VREGRERFDRRSQERAKTASPPPPHPPRSREPKTSVPSRPRPSDVELTGRKASPDKRKNAPSQDQRKVSQDRPAAAAVLPPERKVPVPDIVHSSAVKSAAGPGNSSRPVTVPGTAAVEPYKKSGRSTSEVPYCMFGY